jgi:mannose/fructose/N-acetylgalactosamine-specific phosphotransferase system component IIB
VDDAVASDDLERELYRMGTPPEIDIFFETVDSAGARLAALEARADSGILLTRDVATMNRLTEATPAIREVNVGGLHHRAGLAPRLSYVFLSPEDEAGLSAMAARGIAVTAQDLPATDPVPLPLLLAEKGAA